MTQMTINQNHNNQKDKLCAGHGRKKRQARLSPRCQTYVYMLSRRRKSQSRPVGRQEAFAAFRNIVAIQTIPVRLLVKNQRKIPGQWGKDVVSFF